MKSKVKCRRTNGYLVTKFKNQTIARPEQVKLLFIATRNGKCFFSSIHLKRPFIVFISFTHYTQYKKSHFTFIINIVERKIRQ